MRCKDGSYKWILDRGKIIEWTDDGKPLRIIGTHTDIDLQKKTIEELEKKNVFIQTLLDNLPIGVATNEIDSGRANYINKKFKDIYGWTEEIIADIPNFFEHVYPDPAYRQEIASKVMADIQSGDPARMKWDDVKITTENGEERFVSAVNIPILEQNIMVSTVQDVTEQFIAKHEAAVRNKSLTTLLGVSSLLASTLDLNIVLQNIIDSILNLIDLDSGAIYLINDSEIYLAATNPQLPSDFPEVFRHASLKNHLIISRCINERKPVNIYDINTETLTPEEKLVVDTKNFQSLLYLPLISKEEVHAVLIVGTSGRSSNLSESDIEMCKTFSNIATLAIANAKLFQKSQSNIEKLEIEMLERIKIENALKTSEDKFSKAFMINPDIIIISSLHDGTFIEINEGFTKATGYSYEEVIGKSSNEINIWKNSEERQKLIESLKTYGNIENLEAQYVIKDGSVRIGLMSAAIIEIKGKKCILSITRDITDRKRAEVALKESQERYKALFNNNHSVMLLIEPESGKIIDANPAACNYYGWSREEMLCKKITEINTLSSDEVLQEMELARLEKRNRFFFKHRLANSEIRDVEVFSGSVVIRSKNLLYSIVHDITEQKKAEKLLIDSEEKYRYMFAKNPQPMWIYDLETLNILEVNDAAIKHYGYSRDEFLSMTLKEIRPPEDIPALLDDLELTRSELNPAGEWRHIKKDCSVINVEITSHSVSFNGKPARHVLIKDITERLQFEKQLTDALKEKEILLREVHHRVKNNFQVIVSLLSLQSDLITDPLILNAFKESRNRIKSMALIHELLYQESNFESIDIKHYVKNLVDYLRRSYADTKSNFDISIDMEDIQIEIDTIIPCGLIINELISNSIKHAFPDGRDGEIHISFKKISMESYCLILRDNGIGIPKNIDRSNHKSLGMMLINTLTKQINGELYIESSDKGSEFRIIFKAKN
jgi:PAS domain S-box-containing protein